MKHPFTGKGLINYLLAWTAIISVHAFILVEYYRLGTEVAITDALFYNMLLASLGFSLWWAVPYISKSYRQSLPAIVSYAFLALLGAYLVTKASDIFGTSLFMHAEKYIDFINTAFAWKFLAGSLYLSMIIMIYYLLRDSFRLKQKEKQEHELQHMLKHAELEMLKFQINPHFIFNSLNSISALTVSKPTVAREMVIKLSDFLRGSLGHDKTEMHSLREELEQMNLYLDIEKVRFGDKLQTTLHAEEGALEAMVPNMILQPLYENAIKYGVYEQLHVAEINTRCTLADNILVVEIANDYDAQGVPQKGKGIGLKNIRSRLELIFGIPDLVTIKKSKDKFCVSIEIPQKS
ncbi:MAG: histidine kinase [Fulvivirga sp.]|nr:histidine kinase [Fulvivirga sp.]